MVLRECPSEQDWDDIFGNSLFPDILKLVDNVKRSGKTYRDGFEFMRGIETREYYFQLRHRIADTAISYVFVVYFYNKGIPDKRWSISPGRGGSSVTYFPDFEDLHYEIKKWFDYYSDVFYYKLFSAIDIVGHILNNKQNLKIKKSKVSFSKSLKKLQGINDELLTTLNTIKQNQDFKTANNIRNDITHNYLPSSVGFSVTIDEKQGSVGERAYITSSEIINNIKSILQLFKQILDVI